MIRAVLFDLDDTLLDINLTAFVARYELGIARILGQISRRPSPTLYPALVQAYLAVDRQGRTDSLTNEELFVAHVYEHTGIPLDDPVIHDAILTFDREVVPGLKGGIVAAVPRPGMREAVEQVHELGLICGLATNPLFDREVNHVRMGWAGVAEADFAAVSSLENSRRTKPCADYYLDFLAPLGLAPEECLMVGNDARRDFPRPDIGLRTLYVGHAWPQRAFWKGRPERLAPDLATIIAAANEQGA